MRKIVGFPSLWLTMLGNVLEIKYSPQVMEITQAMVQNKPKSTQEASDKGWEEEYYAYLAEKEANAAVEEKDGAGGEKGVQSCDDDVEDWALQYQQYCIEKEKALDEAERKKKLQQKGE